MAELWILDCFHCICIHARSSSKQTDKYKGQVVNGKVKSKNEMLQKNRDLSVDLAKGIGIMLVVTGHACCPKLPHGIIYAFHMPLFFMLSGLFIQRQCQDKLGVYLKKNFRSLLLPYLYFNLISIAFYYVMSVVLHKNLLNGSVMDNLIGIFVSMRWGTPYHHVLWFLPCLFLAKVMVYPLYHNELWGGVKS